MLEGRLPHPQTGPIERQKRPDAMTLIQSLGPSLPVVLMFFGVLLFSVSMAVVVLLADY